MEGLASGSSYEIRVQSGLDGIFEGVGSTVIATTTGLKKTSTVSTKLTTTVVATPPSAKPSPTSTMTTTAEPVYVVKLEYGNSTATAFVTNATIVSDAAWAALKSLE